VALDRSNPHDSFKSSLKLKMLINNLLEFVEASSSKISMIDASLETSLPKPPHSKTLAERKS
jgi:hypothetical protein